MTPALSTVQQPIAEIGRELIARLETVLSKREPEHGQLLLPPRLILRESCGVMRG